ncbi:hypothetical protein SDC9_179120 [bioreactor metagenome]|uniref:Uncharacterized protein n=1 Tax=bioreactor metagenome TaxID=1076179 RepID=A0A645GZI7_9ZZZZ
MHDAACARLVGHTLAKDEHRGEEHAGDHRDAVPNQMPFSHLPDKAERNAKDRDWNHRDIKRAQLLFLHKCDIEQHIDRRAILNHDGVGCGG